MNQYSRDIFNKKVYKFYLFLSTPRRVYLDVLFKLIGIAV